MAAQALNWIDSGMAKAPKIPSPAFDLNLAPKIQTPIALLALVVLIIGGVFFALAIRLDDNASRMQAMQWGFGIFILIGAGAIVLAGRGGGSTNTAAADVVKRRESGQQKTFMSAPMASLSSQNYSQMKAKIVSIKRQLKDKAGQAEVFWGGDDIEDATIWDRPFDALIGTIERIRQCDNFVLVVPEYACQPFDGSYCKPSSIWWEVGMAVAYQKSCAIFVHRSIEPDKRMPYYLKALRAGTQPSVVPPARIWVFDDVDDILNDIRESGGRIFAS
jgi:hypothetical protein